MFAALLPTLELDQRIVRAAQTTLINTHFVTWNFLDVSDVFRHSKKLIYKQKLPITHQFLKTNLFIFILVICGLQYQQCEENRKTMSQICLTITYTRALARSTNVLCSFQIYYQNRGVWTKNHNVPVFPLMMTRNSNRIFNRTRMYSQLSYMI